MLLNEGAYRITKTTDTSGREVVIASPLLEDVTYVLTPETVYWQIDINDTTPLSITPDGVNEEGEECFVIKGPITKLTTLGWMLKAHFLGFKEDEPKEKISHILNSCTSFC